MLNLDQINQLEAKVEKAIQLIKELKEENDSLKSQISDKEKRNEELENIILVFKNDQAKIEEGIINALNRLSAFEDTVYHAAAVSVIAENSESLNEESAHEEVSESDLKETEEAARSRNVSADNSEQMEIF